MLPSPTSLPALSSSFVCSLCSSLQRLDARFCHHCGKRHPTSHTALHITSPPNVEPREEASPASSSSPSPSASSSLSQWPKRLWDQPEAVLSHSKTTAKSLSLLSALLTKWIALEQEMGKAMSKLICTSSTDSFGFAPSLHEAFEFLLQFLVDRIKEQQRNIISLNDAVEMINAMRTIILDTVRSLENECATTAKLWKAAEAKRIKHAKRTSLPGSVSSAWSFNLGVVPGHTSLENATAIKQSIEEYTNQLQHPSLSNSPLSSSIIEQKVIKLTNKDAEGINKLQVSQLREYELLASHQQTIIHALSCAENMEMDKVQIVQRILLKLAYGIEAYHIQSQRETFTLSEKLNAIDLVQDVAHVANKLDSGDTSTWYCESQNRAVQASVVRPLLALFQKTIDQEIQISSPLHLVDGSSSSLFADCSDSASTGQTVEPFQILAEGSSMILLSGDSYLRFSSADETNPSKEGNAQLLLSPRILQDKDMSFNLVHQPSRLLRLDTMSTPSLSCLGHIDFVSWLPSLPVLNQNQWNSQLSSNAWQLCAVETFLLAQPQLLPLTQRTGVPPVPVIGGSDQDALLTSCRRLSKMEVNEWTELLCALVYPVIHAMKHPGSTNILAPEIIADNPDMLSSVYYRLLIIRDIDELAFFSPKNFNNFYLRQCTFLLSAMLYSVINIQKEGNHLAALDKLSYKIVEKVNSLAGLYCDGNVVDYSTERIKRAEIVQAVLVELGCLIQDQASTMVTDKQLEETDKLKSKSKPDFSKLVRRSSFSLFSFQSLMPFSTPVSTQPSLSQLFFLSLPHQLTYNTYAAVVYSLAVKSNASSIIHTPITITPRGRRGSGALFSLVSAANVDNENAVCRLDRTSESGIQLQMNDELVELVYDKRRQAEEGRCRLPTHLPSSSDLSENTVEESMLVLHPAFAILERSLRTFAVRFRISPFFTRIAMVYVLLDIVSDQCIVNECTPMNTPALTSSLTLLNVLQNTFDAIFSHGPISLSNRSRTDSITSFSLNRSQEISISSVASDVDKEERSETITSPSVSKNNFLSNEEEEGWCNVIPDGVIGMYARFLKHAEQELSVWICHYNQAALPLFERCVSIYVSVYTALHEIPDHASTSKQTDDKTTNSKKSSEHLHREATQQYNVELRYLREKQGKKLIQCAVVNEYRRLRASYPRTLDSQQIHSFFEALRATASKNVAEFSPILSCLVESPNDITLPCLSTMVAEEVGMICAAHEGVADIFVGLISSLGQFNVHMRQLAMHMRDSFAVITSLVDVACLAQTHLKHVCYVSITRLHTCTLKMVAEETFVSVDVQLHCSTSIVDIFKLVFDLVDTFFQLVQSLLPYSLSTIPFFIVSLNELLSSYCILVGASAGEDQSIRPKEMRSTLSANTSFRGVAASFLHKTGAGVTCPIMSAIDSVRMKDNKAHAKQVNSIAKHSLSSLCIRLCNITCTQDKLAQLHFRLLHHWNSLREYVHGTEHWSQLLEVEGALEFQESELAKLTLPETAFRTSGDYKHLVGAGFFSRASEVCQQCRTLMLSSIASRVVFVEFRTPLLDIVYYPLPSSPAVSVISSGLLDTIDCVMAELLLLSGSVNFNHLCEWTLRYLLQSLEWILLVRKRKRGQGIMDINVLSFADIQVLEADQLALFDLFANELNETVLKEISSQSYDVVLQKLRGRAILNAK